MIRTAILLSSTLMLMVVSAPAWSSDAARVAVIKGFAGPQAERIQGVVETGLQGRFDVVPDSRVAAVAQRQGVGLVGDQDFARLGRALDVRAFVSAYTEKQQGRGGWQVRLVVRRGDTGTPVGRLLVTERRLDRLEQTLTRQASPRLQALIERAVAPAEAPGSDEPVLAAAYDSDPAPEKDARPGELFEMTLDGRMFSRSFTYSQNLFGLPEYRQKRAYSSVLEVIVRPGALISESLAPVGLIGGLEYGLRMNAPGRIGGGPSSDVSGYSAALEYRFDLDGVSLAPQAGYAASSFITGDVSGRAPDVRYRVLTAGVASRWAFAPRLALLSKAAYLHVLSAGPLGDPGRFGRASIRGINAEAAVAFAVTSALEVRATAGLRRYGFDMNSQPGDTWVAGGAIDHVMFGGLGLAYRP